MLSARLDDPAAHRRSAEPDARLGGVVFRNAAEFATPRPRVVHPLSDQAKNIVLMAVIVAATLATLILLDHAGIHLPSAGELPSPRLD